MGKFPVGPEKEADLEARMTRLGLRESDLVENFSRASGAGGQHVNKTSTAVQVTHASSGLTARSQESRSQGLNRFLARRRLVELLEARFSPSTGRAPSGTTEREDALVKKIRKQKARRKRRSPSARPVEGDSRAGDQPSTENQTGEER